MHAPLLKHWSRTHESCATQVQVTHLSRHTTKREMIGNGIFVNASLLLNDQQISKTSIIFVPELILTHLERMRRFYNFRPHNLQQSHCTRTYLNSLFSKSLIILRSRILFEVIRFFRVLIIIKRLDKINKSLILFFRKSERFVEALRRLQSVKEVQGLTLQSFLVLPMQRITRLPLLVNVSTIH